MGLYNEFRVAEARPVPHPDVDAKLFRTNTMSLLDNVTGMYIPEAGKEHIILLDEDYGQTLTISVIDWVNNEGLCQNKEADYAIGKGRNKITIRHKGLIYIKYHTDDYRNVKPVKVNFPTASVNGYFDLNKHKPEDFYDILKLASSTEQPHFDMVTSNCVLNYPKTHILSSTLLNSASNFGRAEELLKIYDTVFRIQEIVQGHDKYKAAGLQRGHRNKMLFSTTYGSTYGFSAAYRTGYNAKSMAYDVTNPTKLWNKTATSFNNNIVGSIWGLAHELGHSNQTTAFKWIGLTEVTNNLMCAITQTIFYGEGHTTLRYNDHFNKGMRDIATRMVTDRDGTVRRMTHCESVNTPSVGNVNGGVDPTTQLMPFWQLYMYYHLALGKNRFLSRLLRTVPHLHRTALHGCRTVAVHGRFHETHQRCRRRRPLGLLQGMGTAGSEQQNEGNALRNQIHNHHTGADRRSGRILLEISETASESVLHKRHEHRHVPQPAARFGRYAHLLSRRQIHHERMERRGGMETRGSGYGRDALHTY
ncbi:MAG: M60 family metallopeptidase [Alistipes putredinis]|nr:MAG: M60 family metallopeptidase [Alistipes putredinis]